MAGVSGSVRVWAWCDLAAVSSYHPRAELRHCSITAASPHCAQSPATNHFILRGLGAELGGVQVHASVGKWHPSISLILDFYHVFMIFVCIGSLHFLKLLLPSQKCKCEMIFIIEDIFLSLGGARI